MIAIAAIEVEAGEEVAERRSVLGNVGIVEVSLRVRQVVAAAIGDLRQIPVALDEFDDRGVVGIFMRHAAATTRGAVCVESATLTLFRSPEPRL